MKTKKSLLQKQTFLKSGGKRIRTADPLHAMQVLYQLSYTPLDEFQCNTPLNPMSRINLALSGKFFKVFFCLLFLSSCNTLKKVTHTAKEPPLQKVLNRQEKPPFALENYQPHTEKYTLMHQVQTVDKRNLTHGHAFIHAASPLALNTLLQLRSRLPQSAIHWFYISPHANALQQSIDTQVFPYLAFCQSLESRAKNRATASFRKPYVYQSPDLYCELNYVP